MRKTRISKARKVASRGKPSAGQINRSFIPSTSSFTSSASTSSSSLEMDAASMSHRRSPVASAPQRKSSTASASAGVSPKDPALESPLHISNASVCASSTPGRLQCQMPCLRSHRLCGCPSQISGRPSSARRTAAEDADGDDDLSLLKEEDRFLEIVDLDLKTSGKTQKILFASLVAFCAILLIAYVIAVVFLLAPLLRQTAQPEASWLRSDEVCDPVETCISEGDLKDVFRVFKSRKSGVGDGDWLADLLPKEYSVKNKLYCFKDQKWFHKWAAEMVEIYKEVRGSVNNIEAKQHAIAETINSTKRINNSTSLVPAPLSNIGDVWKATFAHFVVNITKSVQDKSPFSRLKFVRQGTNTDSEARRMDVNPEKGEVKVREAGFYFLYSHVVFKADLTDRVLHRVIVLRKPDADRVLLESSASPTSVLQGVFTLQENDVIIFNASVQLLDTGSDNRIGSYVGLYQLRT